MTEVRFYQLSRDPVERVVPLLVAKALEQGERVLVVNEDPARRAALSEALWARGGAFLAHGEVGEAHANQQPVLLSDTCEAPNRAGLVFMADGQWREGADAFDRAVLLFASEQTCEARKLWSELSAGGHTLRIFKQGENGGWREGG